jgi:undecaprenyl diphosphate synthase
MQTAVVTADASVPAHIAIIMDGNRRWAKSRGLPVSLGHASGARRVRRLVQACAERGVRFLTLFAFSTENWARPAHEVTGLMRLLALYLRKEVKDMNAKGVRLKVIGNTAQFSPHLQALIRDAEANTAHNDAITLTIAANYGGRWDVMQALKAWQADHPNENVDVMNEKSLTPYLALSYAPDPELLIRTGGESRISNFLLWQTAYSELFFSDVLWPDFNGEELDRAIKWFASCERRFGGSGPANVNPVPAVAMA